MAELEGYISKIKYQSAETGFTVFEVASDEEEYVAVGQLPGLNVGMSVRLVGEFTVHKTYGEQFKADSFVEIEPQGTLEIERYLASGAIKGIGVALASRIVRKFKEDTYRIIQEEPERLAEIKGISERKAAEISTDMHEKKELHEAMMFLQKYGIGMTLALKIYKKFGYDIYRIVRDNPYKLADEIDGVGFKTADEIAKKAGIEQDSDFRIKSGVLYTLMQAASFGHTYLPKGKLVEKAIELLELSPDFDETIGVQIDNLMFERKIIAKEDCLYAAPFYYMEYNSAVSLFQMNMHFAKDREQLTKDIEKIEKEKKIVLDEVQRLAVITAAENGVMILTGGPGTGKTTTINAMIRYFEMEGLDIMLAAPTGRAAKRMSEVTGFKASTIHRLLELTGPAEEGAGFMKNEDNPLETDVIIIDEMSMVDIALFNSLLKAIVPETRLILVGDADQLPSVGPGAVLKDLIESRMLPVIELKKIYRQDDESRIVVNAHKINQGEFVELDNKGKDFFFLKRYESNPIINLTLQLIIEKLPKYVNADKYDIQVLTPTRKGLLGVGNLNAVLQSYLNPPAIGKRELKVKDFILREGDKVMQIKNNYQLRYEINNSRNITIEEGMGVFNGDTGIVKKIDTVLNKVLIVFDDVREVYYDNSELDELELAYAVTVHKSQGSEYPAVIIPLLNGPRPLMNRNLLYTAVTRAKGCCVIIGDENVFNEMISNGNELNRYSGLKNRIVEVYTELSN